MMPSYAPNITKTPLIFFVHLIELMWFIFSEPLLVQHR